MLSPRQIAVVSSLALSSAAVAQNAVQWRVEDGGNGHWYVVIPSGVSFDDAAAAATQLGAHLVTIQSAEEQSFVATQIASGTPFLNAWMGLRQDPKSTEPTGGWRWVTGEPLSGYTNWWLGVPQPDNNACSAGVPENFAMWAKQWGGAWADVTADAVPAAPCSGPQTHALLEWSADCNSDGIVDYGQCRDGTLPDYNGNNTPDCCERGEACVVGNYPVQWRVADGGNGHWYQARQCDCCFAQAAAIATSIGGQLASLDEAGEQSRVVVVVPSTRAAKLGGVRKPDADQYLGWQWLSGRPFNPAFISWADGNPGCCGSEQYWLLLQATPGGGFGLHDGFNCARPGSDFILIEWSADCNSDGIVDYGQILDGTLADANRNNIPDCCENGGSCDPCRADVDQSGAINGVDLAAVLNNWGTSGGKQPRSDVNGDGIVDGADLAEVLNAWGPCN